MAGHPWVREQGINHLNGDNLSMSGGMPPQMPGAPPQGPPATRDDLRALKRWIAVAVAWAVAATAVALIALLDGSNDDAERTAGDTAGRVADLQRSIDTRLRRLESRVEGLPQASDVSRLGDRLARVEDQASSAAKDAKSASDKVADLEGRIEVLEDDAAGGDSQTTTPDRP
jgi:hypothetical protein